MLVMNHAWILINVKRNAQSFLRGTIDFGEADCGTHQGCIQLVFPLNTEQLIGRQQALAFVVPTWTEHYNPMLYNVATSVQDISWESESIQGRSLAMLTEFNARLCALYWRNRTLVGYENGFLWILHGRNHLEDKRQMERDIRWNAREY
jgi:hypothetical protein